MRWFWSGHAQRPELAQPVACSTASSIDGLEVSSSKILLCTRFKNTTSGPQPDRQGILRRKVTVRGGTPGSLSPAIFVRDEADVKQNINLVGSQKPTLSDLRVCKQ